MLIYKHAILNDQQSTIPIENEDLDQAPTSPRLFAAVGSLTRKLILPAIESTNYKTATPRSTPHSSIARRPF